jgi:hypothetical protein
MNSGGVRRNALLPTTNTRDWQSCSCCMTMRRSSKRRQKGTSQYEIGGAQLG